MAIRCIYEFVLEELRQFGVHEQLDQQIDRYIDVSSIPQLFALIFKPSEKDYEREHPGLVGQSLSLIWAARRGLAEQELLYFHQVTGKSLYRMLSGHLYFWLLNPLNHSIRTD